MFNRKFIKTLSNTLLFSLLVSSLSMIPVQHTEATDKTSSNGGINSSGGVDYGKSTPGPVKHFQSLQCIMFELYYIFPTMLGITVGKNNNNNVGIA